jgi:hypothetical protein
MSWLFSQALVEAYLGDICLDGAPCALWNGTPTQRASWLPDKTTDASRLSRSGMTFKPLTDGLGEAVLTSFLEAFPAKTSALPERVRGSTGSEAVCGRTWRASSARYDRASRSWKTAQCLWDEDLPESSVTLPRWGMMRDGVLWERTTPGLPTEETESGLWPTPTASMGGPEPEGKTGRKLVTLAVKMWPTPQANEDAAGTPDGKMQKMLGNHPDIRGTTTTEWAGGSLNPAWVEWLMGWPLNWTRTDAPMNPKAWAAWQRAFRTGWTDCAASATGRFRQWRRSHGD